MNRIIFHIPEKLNLNRPSASQLRPQKIIKTFRENGFVVDIVEGYGFERKTQIEKIKKNILKGIKYDFLYSESSTMPTALTEDNHIPFYCFLDFSFFAFCKRYDIKIGLFYRDIYWCFNRSTINWKQRIANVFYRYDLRRYEALVDVLFLPSLKMFSYIPFIFKGRVTELPSGLDLSFISKSKNEDKINILYVGGIGQHYDLHLIMDVVTNLSNFSMTICCRKNEWDLVKGEYQLSLGDNIHIVHKSGDELCSLFKEADLFNLFIEPTEYRSFAVPYKLFEAIGYGCPILASKGTWVADFVTKNQIGMVCNYTYADLFDLLRNFKKDNLKKMNKIMPSIAEENTWNKRVEKIVTYLS